MIQPLKVLPSDVRTMDNSMMSDFLRCPRWYHIRHNLGLSPRKSKAALSYGSLMHLGLAKWYEHKDPSIAVQAMMDEEYEDPVDDFRTRDRCVRKFVEYIEHYSDEDGWIDKILLNETAFELEDAEGFRWGGRMDLLVSYHGKPWVMDHKTTAMFGGAHWFDQFRLSSQMTGYVWAASILHGEPVQGVIVNCIVTHKVPKPAIQQMHRQPILITQERVEEWRRSKIVQYQQIEVCQSNDYFPPNWDGCHHKYGVCGAFDVCSLPESSRDQRALDHYFVHEPWDYMQGN